MPLYSFLPSPNHRSRLGARVRFLVIHSTNMDSAASACRRLRDVRYETSAHYVVAEDGNVMQLVDDSVTAYHAGLSYWQGVRNINGSSIGIEVANGSEAYGYPPFPAQQIDSLIDLAYVLIQRFSIVSSCVVGHSDIAPQRKSDPGAFFPWAELARHKVGIYPPAQLYTDLEGEVYSKRSVFSTDPSSGYVHAFQEALAEYGYDIKSTGVFDRESEYVTLAFQRHFRPQCVNGQLDFQTYTLAQYLVAHKEA